MNPSSKNIAVFATCKDVDRAACLVELLAVCKYVARALACDTYSAPENVINSLRITLGLAEDMASDQMVRFEQILRGTPVENSPGKNVDNGEKPS